MSLNSALSDFGIAKQSAYDTPAAAPTFVSGLLGGRVAGLDATVDVNVESGYDTRWATSADMTEMAVGFDMQFRARPNLLGLILMGIFGEVITTPAGTSLYKHMFSVGADTPFHSIWGRYNDDVILTTDVKFDEVELSWSGNEPIEISVTVVGEKVKLGEIFPPSGRNVAGDPYITPLGGTFKISTHDSAPLESKVTAGTLTFSHNVEGEAISGSLSPTVANGRFQVAIDITAKPDDLALWRASATGSTTGTTPATSPVYGSCEINLPVGDNESLKITSPKAMFTVDFPETNPDGGSLELDIKAEEALGTATQGPAEITLINGVASY